MYAKLICHKICITLLLELLFMKQNNNYKFLADKWTKRHQELQKTVAKKHKKSFEWLSNAVNYSMDIPLIN